MRATSAFTLSAVVVVAALFWLAFSLWHQSDARKAYAMGFPDTLYNWHTIHAEGRGCNACHGSHLADDVNKTVVFRNAPQLHGIFATSYAIPMRVEDCMPCHGGKSTAPFAEQIHAIHMQSAAFANMGGSCESCHATVNGNVVLFDDETRYDLLNGVEKSPTPQFTSASNTSVDRFLKNLAAR
jgi:hypothetical protein